MGYATPGVPRDRPRIPHPGYFAERVRICLIARELSFLVNSKSPQQCVNKGRRELFAAECAPLDCASG